jgi:ribosomal protein L11 methylase PrmA
MYNSVLKNTNQIDEAVKYLLSLNLFPHSDKLKSWDVSKMIDIINKADKNSFVLDIGCNSSPILLMLKNLGFKNLFGCDLFLMHFVTHNQKKMNLNNLTYQFRILKKQIIKTICLIILHHYLLLNMASILKITSKR